MTTPVRLPEGGAVYGLAVGSSEDGDALVAATPVGIYVRPAGVARWQRQDITWPANLIEGSLNEPLTSLRRDGTAFTFPPEELLVYARDTLWLLSKPDAARPPTLLKSRDLGASWSRVAMPGAYAQNTRTGRSGIGGDISMARAPIGARADLRLISSGRDLVLVDATHVWALRTADLDAITASSWRPVNLSGVDLERTVARDTLPSVIRHYLPANEDRDFETLTVLGAQLMIYRRTVGSEQWVLTGTQATIDRQLIELPGTEELYMLEPNALMRSLEQAESWERLRINTPLDEDDGYAVARVIPSEQSPGRSLVMLATRHGAILRSPDAGRTWAQARPADPDRRGVTGIAFDPRQDTMWASTQGQGVLRSRDRGQTWTNASDGIHAVLPLSLATGLKSELLLGGDSGLFELTGSPEDGNWTQVHDRGTSALLVDRDRRRIFSGTPGGAVTSKGLADERAIEVDPPAPQVIRDLYVPPSIRGLPLGGSAVVTVLARPGSDVLYARTHQQGTLVSRDAGRSWAYAEPNALLAQATSGAPWTQFVVGPSETQWLLSQPTQGREPAQLWRTDDDGQTWHAMDALRDVEANERVWLVGLDDGTRLLLARPNALHVSDAGGATWRRIRGPWDDARLVFAKREGAEVIVVLERPGGAMVLGLDPETLIERRRIKIGWGGVSTNARRIMDVEFGGREVYLRMPDEILIAQRTSRTQAVPESVVLLATLAVGLLLAMLGFAVLKLRLR